VEVGENVGKTCKKDFEFRDNYFDYKGSRKCSCCSITVARECKWGW